MYWSRVLRYLGLLAQVSYIALLTVRDVSGAIVLIIHHRAGLWSIQHLILLRHIFGQEVAYEHDASEDEDGAEVVEENFGEGAGLGLVDVEAKAVGCCEAELYGRADEERNGD